MIAEAPQPSTRLEGFADPVLESQAAFRALLDAFAHPGRVKRLPSLPPAPTPLYPSSLALCLTLADLDTAVWLDESLRDEPQVPKLLRFQCGCRLVETPDQADFALISDPLDLPTLDRFKLGTDSFPDRSTTLILQVRDLWESEEGLRLTGPGIETVQGLQACPLPHDFPARLRANRALFPRGLDLVLAAPDRLAALPRSVRIAAEA